MSLVEQKYTLLVEKKKLFLHLRATNKVCNIIVTDSSEMTNYVANFESTDIILEQLISALENKDGFTYILSGYPKNVTIEIKSKYIKPYEIVCEIDKSTVVSKDKKNY